MQVYRAHFEAGKITRLTLPAGTDHNPRKWINHMNRTTAGIAWWTPAGFAYCQTGRPSKHLCVSLRRPTGLHVLLLLLLLRRCGRSPPTLTAGIYRRVMIDLFSKTWISSRFSFVCIGVAAQPVDEQTVTPKLLLDLFEAKSVQLWQMIKYLTTLVVGPGDYGRHRRERWHLAGALSTPAELKSLGWKVSPTYSDGYQRCITSRYVKRVGGQPGDRAREYVNIDPLLHAIPVEGDAFWCRRQWFISASGKAIVVSVASVNTISALVSCITWTLEEFTRAEVDFGYPTWLSLPIRALLFPAQPYPLLWKSGCMYEWCPDVSFFHRLIPQVSFKSWIKLSLYFLERWYSDKFALI